MAESNKKKSKKVENLFGDEEEDYLEEDNYFKIDGKNTFSIGDAKNSKERLKEILDDNKDYIEENNESQKKLISLFYEKIYKTDSEPFNICQQISKQLCKSLNIHSNNIDEKLNFFLNKKNDSKYNAIFEFNNENLNNLGYVLAYAYRKFSSLKIYNVKDLKSKIEKTKNEKMDELIYYYYINYKSQNKNESNIMSFCKENAGKFIIPGPFIFLINSFIYINTIDINFNIEEEKLTKDDINLFIISLLNIPYIFPSKITIKINLIHEEFQCSLYRRFNKELFKKSHGKLKMIYINKVDAYKKKWDFDTEFLLEKHRTNKKISLNGDINRDTSIDDSNNLFSQKQLSSYTFDRNYAISVNNSLIYKSQRIKYNNNNKNNNFNISQISSTLDYSTEDMDLSISKNSKQSKNFLSSKTLLYNSVNPIKMANNPNENIENVKYVSIIEKFKNSLSLMLLTIDSLNNFNNMKRLSLIINDAYKGEFKFFFRNNCSLENYDKFHIIDILINKIKTLEELNIELNILDYITFQKILSFINNNITMTSIKISFFSSDATYLRQSIYKLYYQNIVGKEVSIAKIIKILLPHFIENLDVLFELIKIKDFKKIEVNFDIPDIIEINDAYMNTIFKFLMNLLFLVDNKSSQIQKFVLLSPNTKFDQRYLPSIENILEDINFNENNKYLIELSLHLQLFMLKNIKNLVTENLVILNIGDCDLYTFRELTKFLTSYKFCQKSSLQYLSISLIYSIIKYTNEIKTIFFSLFSIKIKQLIELSIYTNIYINRDEYYDLIDIFKYNWISKYRLIFSPKSELDINDFKEIETNNIIYLVPHFLEDHLSANNESSNRKIIISNKNKKNLLDDNLYWLINQTVIKKMKKNSKFRANRKKIIFNILKYLYLTKRVVIMHQLE